LTYDVLVVGAGPAGAFAAYQLAKQGFRVLLIDRSAFPRDKVCGGGISNKTVQLLDFGVTPVTQTRVLGAYLTYQNREIVARDLQGRDGIATLRRDFDNLLVQKAIAAGVEFRPHTSFSKVTQFGDVLTVETTAGSISARYLLAADGVFSQVRQQHFPSRLVSYAPSVEALVYVRDEVIQRFNSRVLFDFGGMDRGYGWIFPKSDHLNVGIFSIFPSSNIKTALASFMSRYRSLSEPSRVQHLGYCIPLRNRLGLYQLKNIWLLGDAAGFAESFYGEGIYFALKSAQVASVALKQSFGSIESTLYSALVRTDLSSDLWYSELLAKLFFRMPRFGFYHLVRNPKVNYYFAELIGGGVSPRECFYKTVGTLPAWLLKPKLPYEPPLDL
jgi:geranylgeranyl reductase family protein